MDGLNEQVCSATGRVDQIDCMRPLVPELQAQVSGSGQHDGRTLHSDGADNDIEVGVTHYTPEFEQRCKPHARPAGRGAWTKLT